MMMMVLMTFHILIMMVMITDGSLLEELQPQLQPAGFSTESQKQLLRSQELPLQLAFVFVFVFVSGLESTNCRKVAQFAQLSRICLQTAPHLPAAVSVFSRETAV